MGEGAQVVLSGQRVLPRRALSLGYRFPVPRAAGGLADLLSR